MRQRYKKPSHYNHKKIYQNLLSSNNKGKNIWKTLNVMIKQFLEQF